MMTWSKLAPIDQHIQFLVAILLLFQQIENVTYDFYQIVRDYKIQVWYLHLSQKYDQIILEFVLRHEMLDVPIFCAWYCN